MKVIIAGSRGLEAPENEWWIIHAVIESGFPVTEVVCGEARGVDVAGKQWAHKAGVLVKSFPANWNLYGPGAGAIRNAEMANYADALIAVWDGVSPGTKNMIDLAHAKGLKVYVEHVVRSGNGEPVTQSPIAVLGGSIE